MSTVYKYDKNVVLEATNQGLDIILRCYPDQAQEIESGKNFKTHQEKDPSSSLLKTDDCFLVKNFTSGETKNPFMCVIETQPTVTNFSEAIKWCYSTFNLGTGSTSFGGADLKFENATADQKPGEYYFKYKSELTEYELSILGPLVTNEIVEKYNLKSALSFTQIKQYHKDDKNPKQYEKYGDTPQQIITSATETYPIFVFDYGDWQKVYQPLNAQKKYRFRYVGEKPSNFIFGMDLLQEALEDYRDDNYDEDKHGKLEDCLLPAIIIGSGDRDSLNIDSMGYPVLWLNSESATLEYDEYASIKKYTHQVYYLGDIDGQGIAQGIALALKFIDLKVIWLPDYVRTASYRGKPGKDLKDWVDLTYQKNLPPYKAQENLKYKFQSLVKVALPARFWDAHYANGKFKKYTFNNEAAFQFLYYNGFHTYKEDSVKDPFTFIQKQKGKVSRRELHEVANFPAEYVRAKRKGIPLLNFLHRSGQLSERMLSKLPLADIDFRDSTNDSQIYYFKNEVWKITAETIERHKYGSDKIPLVWEDKIIPHKVSIDVSPVFNITQENGVYDIEILRTDNHFFNFLINTSRVHWKVCGNEPFLQKQREINKIEDPEVRFRESEKNQEAYNTYHKENAFNIAEDGLSEKQIQDQKQHLINKIVCIGYLLHKHKRDNQAWIVLAMDDRISDAKEANGGSGKSITFNVAVKELLTSYKDIDGADENLYKSDFLFDGITADTDYVHIDDADQYFPIKKWKSRSTGNFTVNPKGTKAYTISFDDSPKPAITTNFGLYDADTSLRRRILFYVASDYYHFEDKSCFKQSHEPTNDFGKMLIKDFDRKERNDFYNVMAQMCQYFIANPVKVNPPSGNIEKRNAIQTIGDAFYDWANTFFYTRKNIYVSKEEAMTSFELTTKLKGWSSQKFKSKLKKWCEIDDYTLNPDECKNTQGYLKYTVEGETVEFLFINTPENVPYPYKNRPQPTEDTGLVDNPINPTTTDGEVDDLPF